ncbi:MAG: outer membrane lipoprotein carrier protein LolA [Bacteroidales bacterium]|nr:outer membrane lipoprotein carrier protein LolA [Bacteroidales bacterium]
MTKKTTALLIAFFATAAFADETAVLAKIKAANAQIKSIESSFNEAKTLKANGKTIEKQGTFYFVADSKLAMQYTQPTGDKTVINGKNMLIVRDGKARTFNTDRNSRMRNLSTILLFAVHGEIEALCKAVSATYATADKGDCYVVTVNATKKSSKGYSKIEITYNKADGLIRQMIMTENSGDVTTYTLSGAVKNKAIADTYFSTAKK